MFYKTRKQVVDYKFLNCWWTQIFNGDSANWWAI